MPDLKELRSIHNVEDLGLGEPLINKGSPFYEYLVGDYTALVGRFSVNYIDREKKKCKKDVAGAVPSSATLRLIILKDPEKVIVDKDSQITQTEPFGRHVFSQYITLNPDRQWQNVGLLADFTSNDVPEASVIQGKKNEEQIILANLPLYYGCPVKFSIEAGTKKEGSRYISRGTLLLLDHAPLTTDLLKKRKLITDTINDSLDKYLEELKKKNTSSSDAPADPGIVTSQAEDPDGFLGDFTSGPVKVNG